MLLLAIALAKAPIELRLEAPVTIVSGVETRFVVRVTNVSKKTVTLIKAELPNARVGMRLGSEITRDLGRVYLDSQSPMRGQFFAARQIGPEPFFKLDPGESRELYRESFDRYFVDGDPGGLISEVAKARRSALPPGRYHWRVVYRLSGQREKPLSGDKFEPGHLYRSAGPSLTGEAQRLFDQAWKGEATAEATFTVRPAKPNGPVSRQR